MLAVGQKLDLESASFGRQHGGHGLEFGAPLVAPVKA
jgi:hypothetical protein